MKVGPGRHIWLDPASCLINLGIIGLYSVILSHRGWHAGHIYRQLIFPSRSRGQCLARRVVNTCMNDINIWQWLTEPWSARNSLFWHGLGLVDSVPIRRTSIGRKRHFQPPKARHFMLFWIEVLRTAFGTVTWKGFSSTNTMCRSYTISFYYHDTYPTMTVSCVGKNEGG